MCKSRVVLDEALLDVAINLRSKLLHINSWITFHAPSKPPCFDNLLESSHILVIHDKHSITSATSPRARDKRSNGQFATARRVSARASTSVPLVCRVLFPARAGAWVRRGVCARVFY